LGISANIKGVIDHTDTWTSQYLLIQYMDHTIRWSHYKVPETAGGGGFGLGDASRDAKLPAM
jgi:hypothetical protein